MRSVFGAREGKSTEALTVLNDEKGYDFNELAAIIEKESEYI